MQISTPYIMVTTIRCNASKNDNHSGSALIVTLTLKMDPILQSRFVSTRKSML